MFKNIIIAIVLAVFSFSAYAKDDSIYVCSMVDYTAAYINKDGSVQSRYSQPSNKPFKFQISELKGVYNISGSKIYMDNIFYNKEGHVHYSYNGNKGNYVKASRVFDVWNNTLIISHMARDSVYSIYHSCIKL